MHHRNTNLPQPRWSVAKGPTVAVAQAGERIFVTETIDPKKTLRVFHIDKPEEDTPIKVQVLIINGSTGEAERLPVLLCPDEAGQCFILRGKLHVNCGDSLVCWDGVDSTWRTVIAFLGLELQSPAVSIGESILALWHDYDPDTEAGRFRFSKITKDRTEWGPYFASDGYKATWFVEDEQLYVRCQLGGGTPLGTSCPSTLFRIDAESLEVKEEVAVGRRGEMLLAKDQLFCDGEIDFGQVAAPLRHFSVPPALQESEGSDSRIEALTGTQPAHAIYFSCCDLPTLKMKKAWKIWENAHSIVVAPEGKGILITGEKGLVRLLSSRTPDPMVIGALNALVICRPVVWGRYALWLCHLGGKDLHDQWPSRKEEYAKSAKVSFLDEKSQSWRRVGGVGEYEPTYLLAVLDTETGEWTGREIELEEPLHSILENGDKLVFIGWSRIWATALTELIVGARPLGKRAPNVFGDTPDKSLPIVHGLPLTGPRTDDWGFRSDSPVAMEVVKAIFSSDDVEQIRSDSDHRAKVLDALVAKSIRGVLKTWPDIGQLARRRSPRHILQIYRRDFNNIEATPFGSLSANSNLVSRVSNWRAALNKKLGQKHKIDEGARLTARFLLHEYIRRCKTGVRQEGAEPQVAPPLDGPYRDLFEWYNLGLKRQEDKEEKRARIRTTTWDWAKFFSYVSVASALMWLLSNQRLIPGRFGSLASSIGPWVTLSATGISVLLWAAVHRLIITGEEVPSSAHNFQLLKQWPGGCPPLIQDVERRLGYIRDCLESARLIAPHKRNPLQAAVARSWENVSFVMNKWVFISYSHSSSRQAEIIADGLRVRGLGVALDKHELASDAGEWDVETWIAENILATDVVVYIISARFIESGWVNRETEWEHRLYGVKPAVTLPYLVFVDQEPLLRGYPSNRIVNARGLENAEDFEPLIDELALRISYDFMHTLLSSQLPIPHSRLEIVDMRKPPGAEKALGVS
jgi:hypothetical protein